MPREQFILICRASIDSEIHHAYQSPIMTKSTDRSPISRRTAFLLLALSGCLWGTGFPLGKVALAEIGVSHMILYRLLFACLGLAPFLAFRMVRIQRKDWWMFLLTSLIGIPGVYLLQFWGLSKTTVSHAALMVGTLPMLLAVAVVIFTHERLSRVAWIAVWSSALGAVLIVWSTRNSVRIGGPTLIGDLAVLLSLFAATGWILNNKALLRRYPPLFVTGAIYFLRNGHAGCLGSSAGRFAAYSSLHGSLALAARAGVCRDLVGDRVVELGTGPRTRGRGRRLHQLRTSRWNAPGRNRYGRQIGAAGDCGRSTDSRCGSLSHQVGLANNLV